MQNINNKIYERTVTIEDLYIVISHTLRFILYAFIIILVINTIIYLNIIPNIINLKYQSPLLEVGTIAIFLYAIKLSILKRIEGINFYSQTINLTQKFFTNEKYIEIIKNTLTNRKSKRVAIVLQAARELGWIEINSGEYSSFYNFIRNEFNIDIGSNESITKYLIGRKKIAREEIEIMKTNLLGCI